MNNEIWKDIEGYEGLYQVSNKGRVKSFHSGEGKIMKPGTHPLGYKSVTLFKDKKGKVAKVHRLVAQAFIPNPENLPVINHKDENPSNNNVENLEWCTQKYNLNYGTCQERKEKTRAENKVRKELGWLAKFDLLTNEIVDVFKDEFDAAQEQAKCEDDVPELLHEIMGIVEGYVNPRRYDYFYMGC